MVVKGDVDVDLVSERGPGVKGELALYFACGGNASTDREEGGCLLDEHIGVIDGEGDEGMVGVENRVSSWAMSTVS